MISARIRADHALSCARSLLLRKQGYVDHSQPSIAIPGKPFLRIRNKSKVRWNEGALGVPSRGVQGAIPRKLSGLHSLALPGPVVGNICSSFALTSMKVTNYFLNEIIHEISDRTDHEFGI